MVSLDGKTLSVDQARAVVFEGEEVRLHPASLERVQEARRAVEALLGRGERVYGINTGFGKLSGQAIPREALQRLQVNLLRSHALGVGPPLPDEVVRAALLFRLNALLKGYSGVRPQMLEYLATFLNRGVIPRVPEKGSVGSSGDLAPLAHLALPLIGEGQAALDGQILPGGEVLRRLGLEPLRLEPKEGLALINGTQVTLGLLFVAWTRAAQALEGAQVIAALAMEAYRARRAALDERLHTVRPHPGQGRVARRLRQLLAGSRLLDGNENEDENEAVHDPYSLRCTPQVLGASLDALDWVAERIQIEMNAATDNPLIFPRAGAGDAIGNEEAEALSGGNFHGQILGLAAELLGVACAEVGSLAERRIARLLSAPDLPEFLVQEGGVNSGLMVAQYTAAALVSENKALAHPAVVDSIPTSAGFEDHNSMATISARKALSIVENTEQILALELLVVRQALAFRDASKMAPVTRRVYGRLCGLIPPLTADRHLGEDLSEALRLLRGGELGGEVKAVL